MATTKKINFDELKGKVDPNVTERILSHFGVLARFKRDEDGSLRGPCPFFCDKGEGRSFKITADGRAWFNHDRGCKCLPINEETGQSVRGGNMLDFIRFKTKGSIRDAGLLLDELLSSPPAQSALPQEAKPPAKVETPEVSRNQTFAERGYKPLQLDAEADCATQLGLEPDLMREIGAGLSEKGMMKGRLAFPIRNRDGELIAYGGFKARKDVEGPVWLFPKDFRAELEVPPLVLRAGREGVAIGFDLLEACYFQQAFGDDREVFLVLSEALSDIQRERLTEIAREAASFLVFAAPSDKSSAKLPLVHEVVLFLATLAPTRLRLMS